MSIFAKYAIAMVIIIIGTIIIGLLPGSADEAIDAALNYIMNVLR